MRPDSSFVSSYPGCDVRQDVHRPLQSDRLCPNDTDSAHPQRRPILRDWIAIDLRSVRIPPLLAAPALTPRRYQTYPASHLIARLTSRSQHLLALRISEFLHLSPAPVLRHWAKSKIASAKGGAEDEEVCRIIVDKLKDQIDVSCADVAQTAWTSGQIGLATKVRRVVPSSSGDTDDSNSYWITNLEHQNKSHCCSI